MSMTNLLTQLPRLERSPVIFLHAHPDDEAFLTSGLMQELTKRDFRRAVIYTSAAHAPEYPLSQARQFEAMKACDACGICDVQFLPFANLRTATPALRSFADTPLEIALLALERSIGCLADPNERVTLFSYDVNGGYGNDDHIKLHRLGREYARRYPCSVELLEATINRTRYVDWLREAPSRLGEDQIPKTRYWRQDFGTLDKNIDCFYRLDDVQTDTKRRALRIHVTQMTDNEFPLNLPDQDFYYLFGMEYYNRPTSDRASTRMLRER